jgi:hypothetical protein
VIDQSDYYLLISAGRYGSIHPETGLSYTEMEYDYAMEIGKPVIRLLHKDPFNQLRGEFLETGDAGRAALEKFRQKLTTGSVVRFWEDPKELMAETVFALQDIQRRKSAVGWVRADGISSEKARAEIAELKLQLAEVQVVNPDFAKTLSQQKGLVPLRWREEVAADDGYEFTGAQLTTSVSKDSFLYEICVALLEEEEEGALYRRVLEGLKPKEVSFKYYQRDLGEYFEFRSFLEWLEGESMISSYTNEYGATSWVLLPDARVWIRGNVARKSLDRAALKEYLFT